MPRFQLLTGAVGVDLPNGKTLWANRHGHVNVDDKTAAAIRGSSAMLRYDAVLDLSAVKYGGLPGGRRCETCNFAPWPWQRSCPRCGSALTAEPS